MTARSQGTRSNLGRPHGGEGVGSDDDPAAVEGVGAEPLLLALADHVAVHHLGLEAELVAQLVAPLGAEGRRDEHDGPALPLGGELGEDDARLDGLAEPDLVGEDGTAGREGIERKGGRLDLMGVEIDRGMGQGRREARGACAAPGGQDLSGDALVEPGELLLLPVGARRDLRPHPRRLRPLRPHLRRYPIRTPGPRAPLRARRGAQREPRVGCSDPHSSSIPTR